MLTTGCLRQGSMTPQKCENRRYNKQQILGKNGTSKCRRGTKTATAAGKGEK